tara:strand:- start:431 stop:910 length:480 start_codon:yes stop_codon:yes gene_type:complete
MSAERHIQEALDGLSTQLQTSIPAQLNTIETATSLTLPDPLEYLVTQDDVDPQTLGVVYIQVEGGTEDDDWITPQTDVHIPLLVSLVAHTGNDNAVTADKLARYYARAIANAINATATDVSGVWYVNRIRTETGPFGADRYRRRVDVRAEMHLRTTRIN